MKNYRRKLALARVIIFLVCCVLFCSILIGLATKRLELAFMIAFFISGTSCFREFGKFASWLLPDMSNISQSDNDIIESESNDKSDLESKSAVKCSTSYIDDKYNQV